MSLSSAKNYALRAAKSQDQKEAIELLSKAILELATSIEAADAKITAWAARADETWLSDDQTWFSGGLGRDVSMPRGLLMMHFFNHQTHHRGQAHAMITAMGEQVGDTDLFLLV